MIGYVKGTLEDITETSVILDVHGLGIQVYISGGFLSALPRLGTEMKIHTFTYVKEDAFVLYGFQSKDELALFKKLITVSGIGPKGGLAILSALTPDDLRFAIYSGDVKTICKAPGIGKRTAERLVLELKDKVSIEDNDGDTLLAQITDDGNETSNNRKDAIAALTALGYSPADAARAVKKVSPDETMNVEVILKASLKFLL